MKTAAEGSPGSTKTGRLLSNSDSPYSPHKGRSIKSAAMKKRKSSELASPTISSRRMNGKRLIWRDLYAERMAEARWYSNNSCREPAPLVVMGQVSGIAEAGQVTFLMGDSGPGKAVLLNILAQRAKDLKIYGEVEVNGEVVQPGEMESMSSFVGKEDYFMDTLTVHETLVMAATLRMNWTAEEKKARVDSIATEMELEHIVDERIGRPEKRNISRGEMKRLSIACEVLIDQPILFFDDPVLGLENYEAVRIMKMFRCLSREGRTVVCTMTQASSQVFQMADWLVLFTNEQVAFQGPAFKADNFMASCGLPCPQYHSIPDHVLQSIAPRGESASAARRAIEKIVAAYSSSEYCRHVHNETHKYDNRSPRTKTKTKMDGAGGRETYPASWQVQLVCVLHRQIKSTLRNPDNFRYRVLQCLVTGLIQGLVFFRTNLTADTLLTGRGVAFEVVRSLNVLFMLPSIQIMLSELPVVYSDCQRKMYRPSAYILAKGVAEAVQDVALPFLHTTVYYWMAGLSYDIHQYLRMVVVSIFETFIACSVGYAAACIFGDLHRASYAVVMLSLPMMLLSGFFIDFSSIPAVLQPFAYLSWFRYGYMVNLAAVFQETTIIPGCPKNSTTIFICEYAHGPKLVDSWGADPQYSYLSVLAMTLLVLAWRLVAIMALSLRMWRA